MKPMRCPSLSASALAAGAEPEAARSPSRVASLILPLAFALGCGSTTVEGSDVGAEDDLGTATEDDVTASDGSSAAGEDPVVLSDADPPAGCTGVSDSAECYELKPTTLQLGTNPDVIATTPGPGILTITLKPDAPTPAELVVGRVLFRPASGGNKAMLAKIGAVGRNGDVVTVKIDRAPLRDGFSELRVRRKFPVTVTLAPPGQEGAAPPKPIPGKQEGALTLPFNCEKVFVNDGTTKVAISPCSITLTFEAEVEIKLLKGYAKVAFTGGIDAAIGFLVELSKSQHLEKEVTIAKSPSVAIPGTLGLLSVDLSLLAGYEVDLSAKGRIDYTWNYDATSTFGFEIDNGLHPISETTKTTSSTGPTIAVDGSATAQGYLKLQLALTAVGTIEGYINVKPYVEATLTGSNACKHEKQDDGPVAYHAIDWALDAGLSINAGIDGKGIFGGLVPEAEVELGKWEFPVASGEARMRIGECCDKGVCDYAATCEKSTACTQNTCVYEAIADCCKADAACKDGDVCTVDTCVISGNKGSCKHELKEECSCKTNADCEDGDACTRDLCSGKGRCVYEALSGCTSCAKESDCLDLANLCQTVACNAGKCETKGTGGPGCCTQDADCVASSCYDVTCANGHCVDTLQAECASDAPCDGGAECIGCMCGTELPFTPMPK